MKRMLKQVGVLLFALLIATGILSVADEAAAAGKKVTLNGSKITLAVGQRKNMSLIKADGSEFTLIPLFPPNALKLALFNSRCTRHRRLLLS